MKEVVLAGIALLLSNSALSANVHWSYSGHADPQHWASLSSEFSACAGKNQSPINLSEFVEADLAPITFAYEKGGFEILNNGHTVQVNYDSGSYIELDGTKYFLKQFHFHSPSENDVSGKEYPMEAHLVHADNEGNLAVVAVLFDEGKPNAAIADAWKKLPDHEGVSQTLSVKLDAADLLPAERDYYRFNGSLTTPPCTEGVRWLVMKNVVTASSKQIAAFKGVMHGPNNRPLQAVNARLILK